MADVLDWQAFGFPGVFSTTLFLSIQGHRRWLEQGTLPFPNECCRCGRPAAALLDFRPFLEVPLVRFQSRRVHLRGIPHCLEHSGSQPLAFASVTEQPGRYAYAQVVAMHRPFLEQCLIQNRRDGDPPAPWVAFPRSLPFGGFNQGTNEYWMGHSWLPFWSNLSPEARQRYLVANRAPAEWRQWDEVITKQRGHEIG